MDEMACPVFSCDVGFTTETAVKKFLYSEDLL